MRYKEYFKNPKMLLLRLKLKRLLGKYGQALNDEQYLKKLFKLKLGKELNLDNPKTFNEKLQWLKLYDRKPEYTVMVDKYAVKQYVADKIGEEYIIPTLGMWDKFEDIDFDALPNQFVLKCTHDSGGLVICRDKKQLDLKKVKEQIERSLKRDFYLTVREYPYRDVPRKIIAEKFMVDESGYDLKDYKFFCFDGIVKMLFIEKDRAKGHNGHKVDFFDENFEHLPITTGGYPYSEPPYQKPEKFEKMKELAEKLSTGVPQLRVDFYNVNGKIYFGELTFFHGSGMQAFEPEEWDYKLGEWIQLPVKEKLI